MQYIHKKGHRSLSAREIVFIGHEDTNLPILSMRDCLSDYALFFNPAMDTSAICGSSDSTRRCSGMNSFRSAKLSDLSPFLFQNVIEAPDARAGRRKKQEIETEHDGDLAEVVDREKASGKMRSEISNGHFTCQNECHRTGEQAHKHQKSANDFQHAGDTK